MSITLTVILPSGVLSFMDIPCHTTDRSQMYRTFIKLSKHLSRKKNLNNR
ncbi:hypothetical protein STBHUCCB_p190 (plasmid) [Salmonella enterica subsp. enterica serovar Typhi str. P-stx-12]|uniref:Uncharacterized protein n=1 Tax=Escherichia coli TaxID=562 RepID=A0A6G6AKS8_ECOLX|nr:hypothetical protein STBHUCCB_p190 [Salmonella enterica subsp. enterica serovar Typhi str. P-stx-12]EPI73932.1 hypothetical protein A671_01048 [Salmonella enterica subsp. enterica serovar Dublin str. DG22]ESA99695.1 hypothetical protein HMPREF1620_00033 [Escherichia coli 909945-2]ESD45791.1 hypothetical protein HMPREF1604_00265 [Escherichia coli 908519]QID22375.1 hypothetical protein [Escherichia coli]UWM21884.1 hypothetical protein [Morganella morganii]